MSLSDYGVIECLSPTGGWRYEQPFMGGIQRIPATGDAGGPRELLELVRDFRAMQLIEVEGCEKDVADYIKAQSPQNDRWRGGNPPPATSQPPGNRTRHKPLISRIGAFLKDAAPKRPKLVPELEATERAAACAGCPQNVAWQAHCGPCNDEVKDRSKALRQKVIFGPDSQLRACRLHNLPLQAAVFLDRDFLPDRHPEAPSFCWVRK